jgi:hypothetical protein
MNELLFVTAQPDVPYFIWQAKIYIYNFIEKGINPSKIHIIFGIVPPNTSPSKESLELKNFGVNIHHYNDDRRKKHYIPSIKPYLISKWIKSDPSYGKLFFLHDADIIFRTLPDFERLVQDDICYVSDTNGYISYDYIIDCCRRYEQQHPNSRRNQLIEEMANVVKIDVDLIKKNRLHSGGGQYIIKNTTFELWEKIYEDSIGLYNQMLDYQRRFPISPGEIQFWTAEMWSLLWNLWKDNKQTIITNELDFSWATDSIEVFEKKPILHMAGVTDNLKNTKFYKGDFINVDPIQKLREDNNYFNYVDKNSSTVKYVDIMKEYIQKHKV